MCNSIVESPSREFGIETFDSVTTEGINICSAEPDRRSVLVKSIVPAGGVTVYVIAAGGARNA
jgi:hypothetical protein